MTTDTLTAACAAIGKPTPLIPNTENIPSELAGLRQWVTWCYEQNEKGDWTKVLKNPATGGNAASDGPATWGTMTEAMASYTRRKHAGIGFVFTPNDPYTGIDLDHVRDITTGALEPWAREVVHQLASYTELSPSGAGLHIICRAAAPACRNDRRQRVEIYDRLRYFTVTGAVLDDLADIAARQGEVNAFFVRFFPAKPTTETRPPAPAGSLDLSDETLLIKARAAKNRAKFVALWLGQWQTVGYASQSEADVALCCDLAFWTQNDAGRIDRLFRQSGLMREKWDTQRGERGTYGQMTIDSAIARTSEVYNPRNTPIGATVASGQGATAEELLTPYTLADVVKIFRKWLYVPDATPIYVNLAAVMANRMAGDPVWLLTVGVPGSGKTEILQSLGRLPNMHQVATLTEGALLSGTSKRETVAGAKGGLLREIGAFGILLVKDFGSILSLNKDTRGPILQGLREVYDGEWTRHVGTDGGRSLHWQGKIGLIGGATPAIDAHHAVMAILGERFVFYRLPELEETAHAKGALKHIGREDEMRPELARAVQNLFLSLPIPTSYPTLTEAETDWLILLASMAARCRAPVLRDSLTRQVEQIPGAEAPTRLVLVLAKLLAGLRVIGLTAGEAYEIIRKVATDSMPSLRRKILDHLGEQNTYQTTTNIAAAVKTPTNTTRRAIEDLTCYGLVDREPGGEGKADKWAISDLGRELYIGARTLPGIREGIHSAQGQASLIHNPHARTNSG